MAERLKQEIATREQVQQQLSQAIADKEQELEKARECVFQHFSITTIYYLPL
jgi:hypothetical protein